MFDNCRSRRWRDTVQFFVLAIALLSGVRSAPCLACYNDTSVERGEEQFRSQYDVPPTAVPSTARLDVNPWSIGAMCFGSALATASLFVAINGLR